MKLDLVFLSLWVLWPQCIVVVVGQGYGCSSMDMKYWCSQTQTCITLGQGTCPTLDTVFIGPATIKRTTIASDGGGCHVLTPITCGADLSTVSTQLTIGNVFTLAENCALSCKGYTKVTATSGTASGATGTASATANTIFIGPGTIKRIASTSTTGTSSAASCRVLTTTLCGTSATTLGVAAFTLASNCALSCKGYTMITPSTTSTTASSSIVTRGTIDSSGNMGSAGSSTTFGSQQNSQVMNNNYKPNGRRHRALRGMSDSSSNNDEKDDAATPLVENNMNRI